MTIDLLYVSIAAKPDAAQGPTYTVYQKSSHLLTLCNFVKS